MKALLRLPLFVALLMLAGCGRSGTSSREQYKIVEVNTEITAPALQEKGFNELAEEGWKLRTVQGRRAIFAATSSQARPGRGNRLQRLRACLGSRASWESPASNTMQFLRCRREENDHR